MRETFRYVVVDVFTDTPLEGNQLAVFTDATKIPEDTLQRLAREINFSEIVFCYPAGSDRHAPHAPSPERGAKCARSEPSPTDTINKQSDANDQQERQDQVCH